MQCQGITGKKTQCTRILPLGQTLCWQHNGNKKEVVKTGISKNRTIGDFNLFNSSDRQRWEEEYVKTMLPKYSKWTKNFSTKLEGKAYPGDIPPIFVIPRIRTKSYKEIPILNLTSEDLFYAPISKGYPMQEVSSFSLGPIVGKGFCLVNAAFSCSIAVHHIEGGGKVNLSRVDFWQRAKNPLRNISLIDGKHMMVDNIPYIITDWLKHNENLWLPEWEVWSKSIALCSQGDFHWADKTPTIAYRDQNRYLDFVSWKKECYIKPSYQLLGETKVIQFLVKVWLEHKRPLGLVHPKGMDEEICLPLTKEYISTLFNSPDIMCCQPYVIAGYLLGVEV